MVTSKKMAKPQLDIYFLFLSVFTVLCLAGVVAWLSLTPRNPKFIISNVCFPAKQDFKNHSTHHNASVPFPNNTIIFDLQIFNPNKRMGIYYSAIDFELYGDARGVVWSSSIPGFYQGYKNTTMFKIPIHAGRETWKGVNGGDVDFMIRVKSAFKFRIIKWETKVHRVVCEEQFSKVRINLNGTVSGGNYAEVTKNPLKVRIRI